MKAVILAGGSGTRLYPVTRAINKHLLPIPSLMMLLGIREILFVVNPCDLPDFEKLFGDGSQLGLSLSYQVQEAPQWPC